MNKPAINDDFIKEALEKRKSQGTYRELLVQEGLIDFCSNDYLGFATGLFTGENSNSLLESGGGATGSRLVSGNSILAEETERMIARYHNTEAALIFNTGYMANLGLLSSIADKHSVFLYDEAVHASMIDGMRLSTAKRYKFRHNDSDDLKRKLSKTEGKVFVLVESLYSMDGDLAPLQDIADLCKERGAYLIVDEAHATGIYGKRGEGLVQEAGLESLVWARVHTFSKALGGHGAAVVGSTALKKFLINHARSFIYTTALPPYTYRHIQENYEALASADRKTLFALIGHFIQRAKQLEGMQFLLNPSPIQAIIIPDKDKLVQLAVFLREEGFFVKAIFSPTVPGGKERLRICLHSFNTMEQTDRLMNLIKIFAS